MQQFFAILIFCIVLFFYLHIYFQLKTSNDLEVYEIEQPSKEKLEEICDLRQPVIFDYQNDSLLETCKLSQIVEHYGAFDVKLRNVKEADDNTDLHIPVTLKAALSILNGDKDAKYVSEKNGDFLEETGIIKNYKYNDAFLRPPMVSNCFYDFLTASQNTETLLQYSVNYRNFYLVTHGVIKIKLIPPKSARYLYPTEDYENFEFRSPLNPWAIQRQYKADYDKIKTLEIELTPGKIIYIPAYWWYSIKFMEPLSSVCVFKYRTYMNTVAILPKLCMKTLQRQNTKREIVKKVRFQKNEVAKGAAVEKEKDKVKGLTTTTMQYSNDCAAAAAAAVTPVPVPANFESSALISNVNTVNRIDDNGTNEEANEEANEEEDAKKPCNAITLSLVE
jgi:Cupin-like domain